MPSTSAQKDTSTQEHKHTRTQAHKDTTETLTTKSTARKHAQPAQTKTASKRKQQNPDTLLKIESTFFENKNIAPWARKLQRHFARVV